MWTIREDLKFIILLVLVSSVILQGTEATTETRFCLRKHDRCYRKIFICPKECPSTSTTDPRKKVCDIDCDSLICQPVCRHRIPNCNRPGSACNDPRFIGGDGIVFYFHGKSNQHFSLISDTNFQINGRFIGHRPSERTRDFTWIQALGILFDSNTFSLEATKTATWNEEVDHLKLYYNGQELVIPEESLSTWYSPRKDFKVERVRSKNSVMITLEGVMEVLINVVPITKQDDRIHKYQLPADDCFAHLELQFNIFKVSPRVDGVLGRTYRPDFESAIKPGVPMPVVGGEDEYRTKSLVSADCKSCMFSPGKLSNDKVTSMVRYGTLDCNGGASAGNGIVCRK